MVARLVQRPLLVTVMAGDALPVGGESVSVFPESV
jgi:hypothetical protein